MPIQVWLARMERSLTEQEYGDMMALLPDARRERLARPLRGKIELER